MKPKESLRKNSYIFYQPEKREQVSGLRSFMMLALLRVAAFMMCPGDDISMMLAAGNTHNTNMPDSAILVDKLVVKRKESVVFIRS